jgi:hypothetical protein
VLVRVKQEAREAGNGFFGQFGNPSKRESGVEADVGVGIEQAIEEWSDSFVASGFGEGASGGSPDFWGVVGKIFDPGSDLILADCGWIGCRGDLGKGKQKRGEKKGRSQHGGALLALLVAARKTWQEVNGNRGGYKGKVVNLFLEKMIDISDLLCFF